MFAAHLLAICALLVAGASHAAVLTEGQWAPFDVDEVTALSGGVEWIELSAGGPLSFDFTVATGYLGFVTVVDAGFAGDRFRITYGGSAVGDTSSAVQNYPNSIGLDFDAALADPGYSRGVFQFGAGSHSVTGLLIDSVTVDDIGPLNATVGAVRLSVAAVPEPSTLASLAAGLGLIALGLRRRSTRS